MICRCIQVRCLYLMMLLVCRCFWSAFVWSMLLVDQNPLSNPCFLPESAANHGQAHDGCDGQAFVWFYTVSKWRHDQQTMGNVTPGILPEAYEVRRMWWTNVGCHGQAPKSTQSLFNIFTTFAIEETFSVCLNPLFEWPLHGHCWQSMLSSGVRTSF